MILLPNRIVWLWWLRSILVLVNINNRGDDYDFDFACNKDYGGPECIIRWRKTVSSRKQLN
jgi:hypothetical protein